MKFLFFKKSFLLFATIGGFGSHLFASDMVYDSFVGLTAVAGNHSTARSSIPETVPLYEPLRQLRTVLFGERGDEPCFVSTNDDSTETQRWDRCEGFAYSNTIITGGALEKIRVCFNNRSDERGQLLKGVESIWRNSTMSGSGTAPSMSRFTRPNCKQWSDWVQCPAQSSAGRVVLHHKHIGGRDSVVGLQLACYTSVEAEQSDYQPAWNRQSASWSGISGKRMQDGTAKTFDYSLTTEAFGDEYFLTGIGIKEETDEPVQIGVFGHHSVEDNIMFGGVIKLRTITDPLEYVLRALYPDKPKNNERRMGLAAGQFSGANSGYVLMQDFGTQIRGAGVCLSRSQKVKGLRINFVRRNDHGNVIQSFTEEESLAHCHEWQPNAMCADNEAAVGLRMIYTLQKGLTGIRLQCARVYRPGTLVRP